MSTVGNPATKVKSALQLKKEKRQKKAEDAAIARVRREEEEKRKAANNRIVISIEEIAAFEAAKREATIQRKAERVAERAAEEAARAAKAAAKIAEKAAEEKTKADNPSKSSIAKTVAVTVTEEPSADDDDLVIATLTLKPSVVVQPPKINPSAAFLTEYNQLQRYFEALEKTQQTNVLSIPQYLAMMGNADEKAARITAVQKLKKAIMDDLSVGQKPLLIILNNLTQILSKHTDLIAFVHLADIATLLNNYSVLHDTLQEQLIIHFSRTANIEKFIPLNAFNCFITPCARLGIQELELSPKDGLDFVNALHTIFIKCLKSNFNKTGGLKGNNLSDCRMAQDVSEILEAFTGLYGIFRLVDPNTIKQLQKQVAEQLSIELPKDDSNYINKIIFNSPANSLLNLCNSLNRFYHRYKMDNLNIDDTDMETLNDYLYNRPNSGKTLVQGSKTQDHFFFDLVRYFELQHNQLAAHINQRIKSFKSKSGNLDADNHIQAGAVFPLHYPNQRINLTYEMRVGDPWGVSVDIAVGIQDSKEASETLHLYEIDAHPSHHIIRVRRDGIICNNHLNGIDHSKRMFVLDNKKGCASSKGTIVSYTNVNEDYYEYSKLRSYSPDRLAFVASLLPQAPAVNSLVYFNSKYCVCFGYPIQSKDSIASSAKSVTSTNSYQPAYFGIATTSTQPLQYNTKGLVLTTH